MSQREGEGNPKTPKTSEVLLSFHLSLPPTPPPYRAGQKFREKNCGKKVEILALTDPQFVPHPSVGGPFSNKNC
jgi:hypothetical protein